MSLYRFCLCVLFLFCLTACGFKPLLQQANHNSSLDYVLIDPIPERVGQELRNFLIERIPLIKNSFDKPYRLTIQLSETRKAVGYNADFTTSINRLTLIANIQLSPLRENKTFMYTVEKSDLILIPQSIYASVVYEEDIKKRLIKQIADDIIQKMVPILKKAHAKN